uniref:HSR domain-containing protein n=1 Tax=Ursus americanus TaxID=9643 RepID=A0A452R5J6_URSAM
MYILENSQGKHLGLDFSVCLLFVFSFVCVILSGGKGTNTITKPFPFLESLRDCSLIMEEFYNDSQEAHRNLVPVGKVVYNILCCFEKNFGRSLLQVLFSRVHLKEYPDLIHVHRAFKNGNQYPPLPFRSWSTSHLFIYSFAGLTSIHEMFTLSQDLCLSV